ncbi:MAG: hypothetical protein AAB345_05160 [Patescibacteria group bacterium]
MAIHHRELAAGRWHMLSLAEQLGNIGGEVLRVWRAQNKDQGLFEQAKERALDLFDLTLSDPRWKGRRLEIGRAREVFCDAIYGGHLYKSSFSDLTRYFDQFAFAARN